MSTAARTQTNKPIIDPALRDAFTSLKTEIFRGMNCVKIGEIQIFDAAKKTAQIQILFKRVIPDVNSPNGQSIKDFPVLVDCPVFTLQGGGGALQFPIAPGDQCLVLFSDRNIDAWYQNGTAAAPFDARCHDVSDGIALVGLNSLASDLPAYPSDSVKFFYAGAAIELSEDMISMSAGGATLNFTGGEWTIEDSGGATIGTAGSLVRIANNTTSLLVLLDGLIDVIAAATVQTAGTPPLTAATIAALQAYKLQLAALLQ